MSTPKTILLAGVAIVALASSHTQAYAQDAWVCAWRAEADSKSDPEPFKLNISGQKLLYSDKNGTHEFQIILNQDQAIAAAAAWIADKKQFSYLNIVVTMITLDRGNGNVLSYPMDSWLGGVRGTGVAHCIAN